MKNCTCANGHTYSFPDGCNCYKCCANIGAGRIASVRGGGGNTNLNPASRKSFGFGTSYDGRVRGGIKTPDYTRVPTKRKSFNIFDREHETATNNFDSNAPNSLGQTRKFIQHPLDALRIPRVIGATVFDPVTRTWKVDDGRPRGWDNKGVLCWGKCKVRKFFRTVTKCNCNKAGDGCKCDGCLGGATC